MAIAPEKIKATRIAGGKRAAAALEGITQDTKGAGEGIKRQRQGRFLGWRIGNGAGGAPRDERKPHNRHRDDLNAEVSQNQPAAKQRACENGHESGHLDIAIALN